MKDLISVIIPAYNVEKYIEECIKSLLNQTYSEIEIIVVDDGSTDNTYNICKKMQENDFRIKLFKKENGGVSSARNLALKNMNGKYVTFVDSDDIVHPQFLELLIRSLKDNNADISVCANIRFYDKNEITESIDQQYKTYAIACITDKASSYNSILKQFSNTGEFNWITNKLYNRKIISNFSFPEGIVSEDMTFNIEVFKNCNKCVWTSQKTYYYRQREDSLCHDGFHAHFIEIMPLHIKMLKEYDFLSDEFWSKHIAQSLIKCSSVETRAWMNKETEWQNKINNVFQELYKGYFYLVRNKKDRIKINFYRYFRPIYHMTKYSKLKKN